MRSAAQTTMFGARVTNALLRAIARYPQAAYIRMFEARTTAAAAGRGER